VIADTFDGTLKPGRLKKIDGKAAKQVSKDAFELLAGLDYFHTVYWRRTEMTAVYCVCEAQEVNRLSECTTLILSVRQGPTHKKLVS
jgi:hypothetical protein